MSVFETADSDWMVKELATRRSGAPDSPPVCVPGGRGIALVDQDGVHAFATDDGEPVTRAMTVGVVALEPAHATSPSPGRSSALAQSNERARRGSGGAKDPGVIRVRVRVQ